METSFILAIILIVIIMLDLILKFGSRTIEKVQLVILVSATLLLLVLFIADAMNKNYQYPYLIFLIIGIYGIYRKYKAL